MTEVITTIALIINPAFMVLMLWRVGRLEKEVKEISDYLFRKGEWK